MDDLVRADQVVKDFPARRSFGHATGVVHALNGVSLSVRPRETVGLVGESGSGKSTLGRVILGLVPPTRGKVWFDGQDLQTALQRDPLRVRRRMQVVFQDPYGSLDPRMSVERILLEPLVVHGINSAVERKQRIRELLPLVGLSPEVLPRLPAHLSGGQQQRVAIARALALRPDLVVCDEPVSSLDVSIRAQILNLLMDVQDELGMSYLFISHDLGVVRHIADRVAVMYLGSIVELAPSADLYAGPRHPYTIGLMSAIPISDPIEERRRPRLLPKGEPPSAFRIPTGCPFRSRCPTAADICAVETPAFRQLNGSEHFVACHFA